MTQIMETADKSVDPMKAIVLDLASGAPGAYEAGIAALHRQIQQPDFDPHTAVAKLYDAHDAVYDVSPKAARRIEHAAIGLGPLCCGPAQPNIGPNITK